MSDINLYISYYVDAHRNRHTENVLCLLNNVRNREITRLIIICDKKSSVSLKKILGNNDLMLCDQHKVKILEYEERPTYNFKFNLTSDYQEDINIISNSDITFDEVSLRKLKDYNWGNKCMALTRWDYLTADMSKTAVKFYNRRDSQDVWIVKGRFKNIPEADFCLGKRGCDNKIAYLLSKYYDVINPSRTIKTFHLHLTNIRNYCKVSSVDVVPPPYKVLIPREL